MHNGLPLVVAYGAGTNSTAMLCGFRERDIKPDLILFADTGGEMPSTYHHLDFMNRVVRVWWGHDMAIETVRATYRGKFEGLEKDCIRKRMLPSLAYGRKACSQKFKVQPQTKRLLKWMDDNGHKEIAKAIGYDAGESHRQIARSHAKHAKGRIERFWYPLIDWQWRRQECLDAIIRHGIPLPGKSSCFFCPAMKRHEIVKLAKDNPDLFERAVEMERLANSAEGKNKTPRGLTGRALMWSDIVNDDNAQCKLWDYLDENDPLGTPCGCYDG